MEIGEQDLEKFVLLKVMRLNAVIQGIVVGLMVGLAIFFATLWLVLKGGPVVGPHLGLLSQFFIGYDVTLPGSLIGFAYGFAFGFLLGFFTAKIYNWLAAWRENKSTARRRPIQVSVRAQNRQTVAVSSLSNEYSEIKSGSNGREHAHIKSE